MRYLVVYKVPSHCKLECRDKTGGENIGSRGRQATTFRTLRFGALTAPHLELTF